MDSINRNQPGEHREDLRGSAAVAKIREIAKKAQSCFFCTSGGGGGGLGARPMNVRKVDDEGNFWFLIAKDSNAHDELTRDPSVKLYFQGSSNSDFMVLEGRAMLSNDRARIKDLWEPIIKTWFTGGVDDPRIEVVQVVPAAGYYWDTKHGNAVAGVKMVVGAVVGKTLDDSIEGTLSV